MAIKKEDKDMQSLYNIENGLPELNGKKQYQAWEGYSGDNVEDYITRRIANSNIVNMEYAGTTLILTKEDGTTIQQEVTPVPASYDYGIKVFGLKIDTNTYNSGDLIVSNSSTVSLLVGAYGTIKLVGDPKDKGGQVNVSITYESSNGKTTTSTRLGLLSKDSFEFNANGDIQKLKDGISPIELNLTDLGLLKTYQNKGTITIKLIPDAAEGVEPISDTLTGITLTCELPILKYTSEYYTTSTGEVTFNLSGGTSGQYELSGFNNGVDIGKLSDLTYTGLVPGLNQLVVRAKHKEYNSNGVVSNWVVVDLIYTENCEQTVIAVNGVSEGITNNGVAELYHLTVYSPNREQLVLDTYLEEVQMLEGSNLIKRETINPYSYDSNNIYKTNYKKYIEEAISGDKFLMVRSNENVYYKFYTPNIFGNVFSTESKIMTVEEPNTNFMYYKDAPRIYNYDQITGQNTNIFKDNINPNLEATDGWGENNGICYFRATAQTEPVFINDLNLNLQKSSGFSIEFGFKTYNISNKSKPIISIGKLQLWPTQLVWWDESDSAGEQSAKFTSRNSQFQEGVDTHIMITVHPAYKISENDPYFADFLEGNQDKYKEVVKTYSFNLVRIYINGCIDRGFILNDDELSELASSSLKLNPTTADIDLYLLRVYNTVGLSDEVVQRNYNSFIFDKSQKQTFYDHNDITEEINGYKVISFSKTRLKQNTIVLVLPKGVSFPNYTWDDAMEDLAKEKPATMFIGYSDPVLNQQYGGRITNGQIKGQGSSAKRYLIWNVQNSFGKYKDDGIDSIFTSYSPANFDEDTNRFKSDATVTQKNCYVMPTYSGQEDAGSKVKKSVGKVNWASSMQSHKLGACKLYEDAYKTKYPETKGLIGKKAVHEEPFLYFYWETDLDDVSTVELADVLTAGNAVKFAGFQTWGAGKGDKYESGYGDDTPEYLMLEGGENANTTVNFRCPWHALQTVDAEGNITNVPTTSISDSLANPEMNIKIDDESIVYQNQGAWDIDFGCADDKKSFLPEVKTSLIRFRQFYDFVYKHDFTFVVKSGQSCDSNDFITTNAEGNPVADTEHKYIVTVPTGKFTINGVVVSNYKPGDVYRYDVMLKTWVPAGLYYENGAWQKYNVFDEYPESNGYVNTIRDIIKLRFQEGIKEFIDVNDIAFHQAFIKFVSGTDNRAKNTYFQIIGPKYIEVGEDEYERPEIAEGDWSDYKIRLIGDDLDTIFVTDNSGLQSKPYNLLEASYDESFKDHWGDAHNIFFYMFDQCFEKEIIENLKAVIDKAFSGKSVDNKDSYFYKNFFNIQENFPVVAYNHTSRLYYENAYVIKENVVIPGYENNLGVDPIGQIHGSCLPCEKQFMTERMDFLNGYAQTNLSNYYATDQVGGATHAMKVMLKFTPYQDFYPNYGYGAAGGGGAVPYYILGSDTGIKATESLAKKDQLIETIIDRPDAQTYQGIFQMHLYKTLNILGSNESKLPSLQRGTDLYIDNDETISGVSLFKLTEFDGNYPVLENLTLKNIELPSTLSLSECSKLKTIDLSGSSVQKVVLPISGRLQNVVLPKTIQSFEIYNNPGLLGVIFEDYENIKTVYIDCSKCGQFDIANFCENLSDVTLSDVTLHNIPNIYLTEDTLLKLARKNCILTGTITVVDSVGNIEPKKISFASKQFLVNKFGNIEEGLNGLTIIYDDETIENKPNFPVEVSAFYNASTGGIQYFANLFQVNIPVGNDVNIVNDINPFNNSVIGYLDIKYSLQNSVDGVDIDALTGTIKVEKQIIGSTKIIVTITTSKQVYISDPITVSFAWKAPSLGDFAYADGTFSSNYNPNKTLVGLVYAREVESEESGTVYIIGKEYFNQNDSGHYLGYTTDGASTSASEGSAPFQVNQLKNYVETKLSLGNYQPTNLTSTTNFINGITYDHKEEVMAIPFSGKSDTKAYVDLVNNNVLQKLKEITSLSAYILNKGGNYSIDSIDNLNQLCTKITSISLDNSTTYNSALLYPYFYSAYLYQPTVNEGEILDSQYTSGNWYAPSVGELSRIIYYRGYSAAGDTFNVASFARQDINPNLINYDDANGYRVPIFSLAYLKMAYFPTEWNNIVGSGNSGTPNNIVTNTNSTQSNANNYSYQVYYNGNNEYPTEWLAGSYHNDWYGYQYEAQMAVWRYKKHKGLPFTQYKYSKPEV